MSSLESTERLAKLGFDQKLVAVLAKNDALSNRLLQIYSDRSIEACSEQKSHLLYTLCAGQNAAQSRSSELIADLIFADKILTKHQVKLAEEYLQKHAQEQVDMQGLEQYCGVGVEIEDREVKRVACQFVERYRDKIREKGYRLNCPDLLNELKRQWTIANPADLIRYANEYLTGIRQKADPEPQPADAKQPAGRSKSRGRPNPDSQESGLQKVDLAKLTARDLCESLNSPELLQAHQQATQGKIITRFPPEPNGILHIGHARAIRFNFSISGVHQGECNLRYDDTNPETERKEYMDMIEENVRWMGFEPTRIVHASHYFEKIFELTLELIRQEKAYVCKLPQEVMRRYKQEQVPSPYRETDAATNLREFELMRRGFYGEGEAVLRAKIDYRSANTTLRDPVLYRVLFTPHPVTGTRWCIYPMYDYAHPLSDSLEHVTHSCCTLEFETRRDLYYWPLQQLNLFKPFVWEFSRLNLTFTLTSKRKIARLIEDRAVAGWNDPRLFTIEGLKRRGVPVEALNEFLDRVPVTRRGNENYIQMELFESVLRSHLDRVCERVMGVVDPVALTLSNLPVESCLRFEALHHPPDSR